MSSTSKIILGSVLAISGFIIPGIIGIIFCFVGGFIVGDGVFNRIKNK